MWCPLAPGPRRERRSSSIIFMITGTILDFATKLISLLADRVPRSSNAMRAALVYLLHR